mgnify:CR=1 FL=1
MGGKEEIRKPGVINVEEEYASQKITYVKKFIQTNSNNILMKDGKKVENKYKSTKVLHNFC